MLPPIVESNACRICTEAALPSDGTILAAGGAPAEIELSLRRSNNEVFSFELDRQQVAWARNDEITELESGVVNSLNTYST